MSSPGLRHVLVQAQERGFLGPGPVQRQLAHAQDLAVAIGGFAGRFLDLGSGSGLPGLVLAIEWPDARATLLDSQVKRCGFLAEAVEELSLGDRVDVACGRAETLARDQMLRSQFDLVVARAFASPAVTAECAVGFLAAKGRLVVTEPPGGATPSLSLPVGAARWSEDGLAQLGLAEPVRISHGETGAVVLRLDEQTSDHWPRRNGLPAKRPLW